MSTNDEIKAKYYLYGKYLPLWISNVDIDKALNEARAEGQKDIIKEFESKIITIETDTGGTFTGISKVIFDIIKNKYKVD